MDESFPLLDLAMACTDSLDTHISPSLDTTKSNSLCPSLQLLDSPSNQVNEAISDFYLGNSQSPEFESCELEFDNVDDELVLDVVIEADNCKKDLELIDQHNQALTGIQAQFPEPEIEQYMPPSQFPTTVATSMEPEQNHELIDQQNQGQPQIQAQFPEPEMAQYMPPPQFPTTVASMEPEQNLNLVDQQNLFEAQTQALMPSPQPEMEQHMQPTHFPTTMATSMEPDQNHVDAQMQAQTLMPSPEVEMARHMQPTHFPTSVEPRQPMEPELQGPPDFSRMALSEILQLNLTVREIIDFDLVERFVSNVRASKYLQGVLTKLRRRPVDEDEEAMAITSLIDYVLRADHRQLMRRMASCVYGNYLLQILVTRGHVAGADRHHSLFNALILPSAVKLTASRYGCRVVQSALGAMPREYQLKFAARLERHMAAETDREPNLLINPNASHVLQILIAQQLPKENVTFLARALEKDLIGYAQEANACRVAQAFVEHYGAELDVEQLFEKSAHLRLSTHLYGNYVVQCFAEHVPTFAAQLVRDVFRRSNLHTLGQDKYGSNVLEMCLHHATRDQIGGLVRTLRMRRGMLLRVMAWNEFGNYVVKTLVDRCDREQQLMLIEGVHKFVTDLTEWRHGQYGCSAELVMKCRYLRLRAEEAKERRAREERKREESTSRGYRGRVARSRKGRHGRR